MDKSVVELERIAEKIHKQLTKGEVPEMYLSARTKKNIVFDEKKKVYVYGKTKTTRSAKKLDGAYMLLRTTYLLDFIKEMALQKKSSTLRELYYISEAWELGKFGTQNESNNLIEDLEIITAVFHHFGDEQNFGLTDIIKFLDCHPSLKKKNQDVVRRWRQYRQDQ